MDNTTSEYSSSEIWLFICIFQRRGLANYLVAGCVCMRRCACDCVHVEDRRRSRNIQITISVSTFFNGTSLNNFWVLIESRKLRFVKISRKYPLIPPPPYLSPPRPILQIIVFFSVLFKLHWWVFPLPRGNPSVFQQIRKLSLCWQSYSSWRWGKLVGLGRGPALEGGWWAPGLIWIASWERLQKASLRLHAQFLCWTNLRVCG